MNPIYIKNIKALEKINPNLAQKVHNLNIVKEDFEVIPTKESEQYTLKFELNGSQKLVHSQYRPTSQAKKVIDNFKMGHYNLIGVAGIGCGHYIRQILNRFNKVSQLVIFENRLDILKAVMMKQDLTDIFNPSNVKVVDCTSAKYINYLNDLLRRIDYVALAAGNVNFFKTPVLKDNMDDKYRRFQKRFFSTIKFIAKTVGNDPGDTIVGLEHAFANIEHILNSPNLNNIKEYQSKPVVCVAAGPSLDKNIDVLKEYQDKVFIICADTVLEKLLKYGIKPDIVGVLERKEKVYRYFFEKTYEKGNIPEDITLVCEGVVYPKILDEFPGKKVTVFRDVIAVENWFVENIKGIIGLDPGNSVAILNFSIAQHLGCSPIILIGQDLAFSQDGKAHTGDTGYDDHGDDNLQDQSQSDLVEVIGYNGEKLETKKWWKIFKEWFELKIVKDDIHCIDATEGGAYIEGTEVMTLKEVAEKYFTEKKIAFNQVCTPASSPLKRTRREALEDPIKEKIKIYKDIINRVGLVINLVEDSRIELIEKNFVMELALEKFQIINTEIAILSKMDSILYFICQSLLVARERYKVKMGDLSKDTKKKFMAWFEYDLDKLNDIRKIAEIVLGIFENNNYSRERL